MLVLLLITLTPVICQNLQQPGNRYTDYYNVVVPYAKLRTRRPGDPFVVTPWENSACSRLRADIVFLLDGSDSIGNFSFHSQALRFVKDFVSMFNISPRQTRIGITQFSNVVRHEFFLNTHRSPSEVNAGINSVTYLRGMTWTASALDELRTVSFSAQNGARFNEPEVAKICIVITDGKSQQEAEVPQAAKLTRDTGVKMFAVGVTQNVRQDELLEIVGGVQDNMFLIEGYKGLSARLRNLLLTHICPVPCDPRDRNACDRSRNEQCNLLGFCGCAPGFQRDPVSLECGAPTCIPGRRSGEGSCPPPEVCKATHFGDYRCACPTGFRKMPDSGICVKSPILPVGPTIDPNHGIFCLLEDPNSCNAALNEVCDKLPDGKQICVCPIGLIRHPVTRICHSPSGDQCGTRFCQAKLNERCINGACQCPLGTTRTSIFAVCQAQTPKPTTTRRTPPPQPRSTTTPGFPCGDIFCNRGLGEICVRNQFCNCPPRFTRRNVKDRCEFNVLPSTKGPPTEFCSQGLFCRLDLNEVCIDGTRCGCAPDFGRDNLDLPCEFRPTAAPTGPPGGVRCGGTWCKPSFNEVCSQNAFCVCQIGFTRAIPSIPCSFNPIVRPTVPSGSFCRTGLYCKDSLGEICIEGKYCDCPPGYGRSNVFEVCSARPTSPPGVFCRVGVYCRDELREVCINGQYCGCPAGFDRQFITELCRRIPATTAYPGEFCSNGVYCKPQLHEECRNGRCVCPHGTSRLSRDAVCEDIIVFELPLYVIKRGNTPLVWSSSFADKNNAKFVDVSTLFNKGIADTFGRSVYQNHFRGSEVEEILNPRMKNQTLSGGVWFIFKSFMTPDMAGREEAVHRELVNLMKRSFSYHVGNTDLIIAEWQPLLGQLLCNGVECRRDLGEVCFGGRVCGCPLGYHRKKDGDNCRQVDMHRLYVRVIKEGFSPLSYTNDLIDTNSETYRRIVDKFTVGANNAYQAGNISPYFVGTEVNDITDPQRINSTWNGIGVNFTVFTERGRVPNKNEVWYSLWNTLQRQGYIMSPTDLQVAEFHLNPFGPCMKRGIPCDNPAWAFDRGNQCLCDCPPGFTEQGGPFTQRKRCVDIGALNECTDDDLNHCDTNAICIDMNPLYRCECKPGFVDCSAPNKAKGTCCETDPCVGFNCGTGAECFLNADGRRGCRCVGTFVEVSRSGPLSARCLALTDVNECSLGRHNCSPAAYCTDFAVGYSCRCKEGFTDQRPLLGGLPGRYCAGEQGCARCKGRGQCVTENGRTACRCDSWFTGEFCQTDTRIILAIVAAILFLLLSLCCLLFYCLKCRCVKTRPQFWPWGTVGSSASGADLLSKDSPYSGKSADAFASYNNARVARRAASENMLGYLNQGAVATRKTSDMGLYGGRQYESRRTRAYDRESYSGSSRSSDSGWMTREEIERKVKDNTRTVTTERIRNNATAEFRVYPPADSIADEADRLEERITTTAGMSEPDPEYESASDEDGDMYTRNVTENNYQSFNPDPAGDGAGTSTMRHATTIATKARNVSKY